MQNSLVQTQTTTENGSYTLYLYSVSRVQISLCRKRTTASYSGEGYNGTSQIQAIFFVNGKSHVKYGFSATNIDNLTDIKLAN